MSNRQRVNKRQKSSRSKRSAPVVSVPPPTVPETPSPTVPETPPPTVPETPPPVPSPQRSSPSSRTREIASPKSTILDGREIYKFKIVAMGRAESGKTSFFHRHATGRFNKVYTPTTSVQNHYLVFNTNCGEIHFDILECPGQKELTTSYSEHYQGADAAMIFYSSVDRRYCFQVRQYYEEFRGVCPDAPVTICINKCDLGHVQYRSLLEVKDLENVKDFYVSALTCYQFELPFLFLARQLMGNSKLLFVNIKNSLPIPSSVEIPIVLPDSRMSDLPVSLFCYQDSREHLLKET